MRCLSSCSYIKPQRGVVVEKNLLALFIILFLHQTTTPSGPWSIRCKLFIILFLHQTTTKVSLSLYNSSLFIILFLHQTTTIHGRVCAPLGCLSSCSYIKPQHSINVFLSSVVVYHLVPTSNHNPSISYTGWHSVVYHLVPTSNHNLPPCFHFSLLVVYHLVPTSNHNSLGGIAQFAQVVYHLVPTSNHNEEEEDTEDTELFIILFLHQTTTCVDDDGCISPLFIILFLHQTTTKRTGQQRIPSVVYHLVPTSNHNLRWICRLKAKVVYHLVPTSNHNLASNVDTPLLLFIILFLHQTTTYGRFCSQKFLLFIILFLHQTTTAFHLFGLVRRCLSSCSYIKPQPTTNGQKATRSCLSSCSYIKPQRVGCIDTIDEVLFIILFLHQTTTFKYPLFITLSLFIILFLHQTTTNPRGGETTDRCLSSCSYIKPQLSSSLVVIEEVVYHLVPTSNHNSRPRWV